MATIISILSEKVLLNRAVVRIVQREDGATIIDSNGDSFEVSS